MSLRFFADHCISNFIINSLQHESYEVLRLRDHMPVESPDRAVIEMARELNCILVSLNGDFSDIVSYPPADFNGIISLQVRNRPETIPAIIIRLKNHLAEYPHM